MNLRAIRKSNRTLIVVGMVLTMVLSAAGVATAAYQPVATESNTLDLQPTEAGEGATAKFTYDVETKADGTMALTNWEIDIKNIPTNEEVDVFLVPDDEGDAVNLGTFKEDGSFEEEESLPVENFQNYDVVDVSRWSDQDDDWVVMLKADLP